MNKRVVIKIGSRVLTNPDLTLNADVISALVAEISHLTKTQGIEFVIVTSGAVSLGRSTFPDRKIKARMTTKLNYHRQLMDEQILASIGQPMLMAFYIEEFRRYSLGCAQLLVTRKDLAEQERYLSLKVVTDNLISHGRIPIFNENDVLTPEELEHDLSDNDQLASIVGAMVGADLIIVLTNVDGIYNGPPNDPASQVVPLIEKPLDFLLHIDDSCSTGKGGMYAKLMAANRVTLLGMDMHVANGRTPGVITKILGGETLGTRIPAQRDKQPHRKSWIGTGAISTGKIMVSTSLVDILRQGRHHDKPCVLLISVEKIIGSFKKGDIVEIVSPDGESLGKGRTNYGSWHLARAVKAYSRRAEGDSEKWNNADRIVIHYDYLAYC